MQPTVKIKIKAAVDLWITIIIWSSILILVFTVLIVPEEARLITLLSAFPAIVLLLWIYNGSWYELREEYLFCRLGPFSEKIYYDKVKSLKLSKNLFSSMALSMNRIEIRQRDKGYITGTTLISPANREYILAELIKRCKNLEAPP